MSKPVVGLALSAGSARGLGHIGVLHALEENNIHIDCIAGSSAGALIGGIYCCGVKPLMIKRIAMQLERKLWVDLTVPRRGFIKGKKIEEMLKLLTKNRDIEDLEKNLSVVSTDIKKGKPYIFTKGPLYKAIRASISIPGIFVPVKKENMVLVDGAVIDRIPISLVKKMGADIVIAVDVGFSRHKGTINHVFDVILQSIDIMSKQISEKKIVHADILLQPDLSDIKPQRFDQVEESFNIGYEATKEKIHQIKKIIQDFD